MESDSRGSAPKSRRFSCKHWRMSGLLPFLPTAEAQKAQNHVIFLENFSDELRRKVTAGK